MNYILPGSEPKENGKVHDKYPTILNSHSGISYGSVYHEPRFSLFDFMILRKSSGKPKSAIFKKPGFWIALILGLF